MHRLSKAQLCARKKRRARSKRVRAEVKQKLKEMTNGSLSKLWERHGDSLSPR